MGKLPLTLCFSSTVAIFRSSDKVEFQLPQENFTTIIRYIHYFTRTALSAN